VVGSRPGASPRAGSTDDESRASGAEVDRTTGDLVVRPGSARGKGHDGVDGQTDLLVAADGGVCRRVARMREEHLV
jgi:hypothetical protein